MEKMVKELNMEAEDVETLSKDERKQRRERQLLEAHADLQCGELGCVFRTHNRAGLVNHQRQKHKDAALETLAYPHCGGQYRKQGFKNHVKFCSRNPDKTKCTGWKE